MFGIKFKPAALSCLLNITMASYTDKVMPLALLNSAVLNAWIKEVQLTTCTSERIDVSALYITTIMNKHTKTSEVTDSIVEHIFTANGNISVAQLAKLSCTTERQLQRLFQKFIGIPPKFYCRIIRFNYIFQLLQHKKSTWLDITHHSGYFDQSHFIRDFRAFSGEDPSQYFVDEKNMANFFLKRTSLS